MNKAESKYFNTARKMNDSFLELLKKKDFEYITIKEICEHAKVNRSTFYLHYENTYDLLMEVINYMNESFNEAFKGKRIQVVGESKEKLFLITDEYLIPYLQFIKKNKKVYKAIKDSPTIFKADDSFQRMYDSILSPILDKHNVKEEEKKMMIQFYINGVNALVLEWINNDCVYPVEDVCSLIKKIIKGKNMSYENRVFY